MNQLTVHNPSDHEERCGIVEVEVGDASVPLLKQSFAVQDKHGNTLEAQYDVVDKTDRTRDRLLVRLDRPIPPGGSTTLTIVSAPPGDEYVPGLEDPRVHVEEDNRGVKLINDRLDIFFSLVPDQVQGGFFYGGAVTSVVLTTQRWYGPERVEILDAFNDRMFEHDPQKRCMQIDLLQFFHPATDPDPLEAVVMSHRKYEVVAKNQGRLRASVTVASEPFDYTYRDPLRDKKADPVTLQCRLYRVLSIYRDDAVTEQVYVRGSHNSHTVDLHFTARYFTYMDLGRDYCNPIHYREIPDWLALGCAWDPGQGYGFCTDVHATPVQWPHPEFAGPGADHTFSWSLGYSAGATCVHLFKLGPKPELLAHETGRAWYYRVYQPLEGKLV